MEKENRQPKPAGKRKSKSSPRKAAKKRPTSSEKDRPTSKARSEADSSRESKKRPKAKSPKPAAKKKSKAAQPARPETAAKKKSSRSTSDSSRSSRDSKSRSDTEARPAKSSKSQSRSTQRKSGSQSSTRSTGDKKTVKAKSGKTPTKSGSSKSRKAKPKKAPEKVGFESLDLSDEMLDALELAGYTEPTPVQAGVIPEALDGLDIIGQAQTGTGKTAAFAIPILEQLAPRSEIKAPQALVLVPTRELAVQVSKEFDKLAHGQGVRIVCLYGGKPLRGQIDKLQRGVQVIVGTPGRVLDHIQRGTLQLREVWGVVLDEADRMLDIGFRPDIERIMKRCTRKDRQTLLLSATVAPPVLRIAERYMKSPKTLNFSPKEVSVDTIDQYYFTVDHNRKFDLLIKLLEREKPTQAIVFCRTKRRTERIYLRLKKRYPNTDCMHGDMNQGARDRVMQKFRDGKVKTLVATDVVGRGIDVSSISHIINFDTPQFSDDYVHRVGRTGRMGRDGVAYTFVAPEEGMELTRIEQRINRLLVRDEIDGLTTESEQPEEPKEEREVADELKRRPTKRYRRAL